jgi:predicted dehydrogenase
VTICYVAITNAERRDDTKRPVNAPSDPAVPPAYRPAFPSDYRPGVGIIGCGGIVKLAHLPAYTKYGVDVVGVFDASPEATEGIQARFPVVGEVFASVDELLDDPRIHVVDIATHPAVRRLLIEQAIDAGKHVLSQKPFAVDLAAARALVAHAERSGVRLAVNQNGRWAPPWRIATLLIEHGQVGEVCAVTHLFEHDFDWTVGTPYDEIEHFVLYDFAVHWIDITRCWLADRTVATVSAREYRTPSQAPGQKAPWGALVVVDYVDGTSAVIRSIGVSTRRAGNPFWVHGTEGTIRGSIRKQTDFVELERDGASLRYALDGEWLPDGFAGTMAELCSAVAEDREPFNSARHNLLTLEMTLAACRSADEGSRPVALSEVA